MSRGREYWGDRRLVEDVLKGGCVGTSTFFSSRTRLGVTRVRVRVCVCVYAHVYACVYVRKCAHAFK